MSVWKTVFDFTETNNITYIYIYQGRRRKFGNTVPTCLSLLLSVIYYRLISAAKCTWNVVEPWGGRHDFSPSSSFDQIRDTGLHCCSISDRIYELQAV